MLPRLLSEVNWSSASSPILLGLQQIHTVLKPKDAKFLKKRLLYVEVTQHVVASRQESVGNFTVQLWK